MQVILLLNLYYWFDSNVFKKLETALIRLFHGVPLIEELESNNNIK